MLVSTSNYISPVPLLTTPNGQGPTLAAGPTLCDLPLHSLRDYYHPCGCVTYTVVSIMAVHNNIISVENVIFQ